MFVKPLNTYVSEINNPADGKSQAVSGRVISQIARTIKVMNAQTDKKQNIRPVTKEI